MLLADIDPQTAGRLALVLQPLLSLSIFLMLVRIVLTWYPNVKLDKLPWSVAVAPTEPFLGPTRRAVPPVGGVDVAPVRLQSMNMHAPSRAEALLRLLPGEGGTDAMGVTVAKPCQRVLWAQIIWLALFSFVNEILLGPQGILNLLQRKLDVL